MRWVRRLKNENHHILHMDNLVSSMRSGNQWVGSILHIMNRNILFISVRGERWVSWLGNENHHILHIYNLVSSMRSGNQWVGRILHNMNRNILVFSVRVVWVSRNYEFSVNWELKLKLRQLFTCLFKYNKWIFGPVFLIWWEQSESLV